MADITDAKKDFEEERRRKAGAQVLENEAEARAKRIEMRKDQKSKADKSLKEKKRKRVYKIAGIWVALIVAGLFALTWFSGDLVEYFHDLVN